MAINTEKTEENPDFGRGLYVCEQQGIEFSSMSSSGFAGSWVASQGFVVLIMFPVISYFVLRELTVVPIWITTMVTVGMSVAVAVGGTVVLRRVYNSGRGRGSDGILKKQADSRYRVRAVIPKKRQASEMIHWAHLTTQSAKYLEEREGYEGVSADELEAVRGGFEPMIIRPWFGIKRGRAYVWTAVVMGCVLVMGVLTGLGILFGGWRGVMDMTGLMGYALIAFGMVSGVCVSELIWPVYIRLVPGQLDIFRYGFLGSGEAEVESFDLRTVGVCVDFGGYIVAIEPAREVGEPLPAMVIGKRWPNHKVFPEGHEPMYLSALMVPGRREFAQRLIQAARTDEPTPPVSLTSLGE